MERSFWLPNIWIIWFKKYYNCINKLVLVWLSICTHMDSLFYIFCFNVHLISAVINLRQRFDYQNMLLLELKSITIALKINSCFLFISMCPCMDRLLLIFYFFSEYVHLISAVLKCCTHTGKETPCKSERLSSSRFSSTTRKSLFSTCTKLAFW